MSDDEEKVLFVDKRRIKSVDDSCDDAAEADLERLPTYVDQLTQENKEREERLKEYIAAHKEKMAEADQVRKRLEGDVDERANARFGDMLTTMLPVLDDFDRAIAAVGDDKKDDPLLQGVVMLKRRLVDVLAAAGLTVVDTQGKPFDPETAQAVSVERVEDEALDNVVTEQMAPGYAYKGRTLRPAMVRVGQKG